ncbi:MAG: DUF456 domain-containing protein [Patescibacteria group bacterium]|nr:DUF456 domain-containing protein [Patescibacteria group bacterium]
MNNALLVIIFFVLMLPGIAGAFLPLPGLLYMFIISLIYGFVDKFAHLQLWELGVLAGIMILSTVNDYLSGMLGAKYGGAAQKSMLYGIIGMIIGLIIFPPFGGLVGVFVGILIAELIRGTNQEKAVRAATGGLVGSIVGMIVTLVLAIIFLFLFTIFAVK